MWSRIVTSARLPSRTPDEDECVPGGRRAADERADVETRRHVTQFDVVAAGWNGDCGKGQIGLEHRHAASVSPGAALAVIRLAEEHIAVGRLIDLRHDPPV